MQDFVTIGSEVAGYRVESFLGRGGMAVVYRAEDLRLNRWVALKLLAPELSQNERFQQRFMRESQLAASIDHPNIIPIYEAGEADGLLYIVMRYVEGNDLKALVEREGPLDPTRTVSIFAQVAGALDAAHARGLVHRDVKPGNILVASGTGSETPDHVYLTDFGLTKRSSSLSGFTTTGHFIGTIDYIAPEQISGKPVDGRTDIYALGCVLYQCMTGEPPFQHDDDTAVLWAHLVGAPPSLTSHRPDLPPGIDAVLSTAMAKAPEDRYATCRDFVRALRVELGEPSMTAAATAAEEAAEEVAEEAADSAAYYGQADHRGGTPAAEEPSRGDFDPDPDPGYDDQGWPLQDQAPPRAGRSRRRGRGPLVPVLLTVLLLVVAGAAGLYLLTRGDAPKTFSANDVAPFSFSYPGSWKVNEHSNLFISFAPYNATELFSQSNWRSTNDALREDPGRVWGLYTRVKTAGFDVRQSPDDLDEELTASLPGVVSIIDHQPGVVRVDGFPAAQVEGEVTDRGSRSTLRFLYLVVQVDDRGPQTVHLIFFSSTDAFDEARRGEFERIKQSVRFDRERLKILQS